MITVTAVQVVKPGKEGDLKTLMMDLTRTVRANEPGCVTFDWVQDNANPAKYLVIEQYADQTAFMLHKSTHYLADFIPHLMQCLEHEPLVTVYGDVVSPPPQLPRSFFHIGMVVPDLEVAIARYSDVLGIKFAEPATFHVPRLEDPEPHVGTVVGTFSMTQPPYIELIQAAGDGIISADKAGRILYFACWERDMAGRLAKLQEEKVGLDALFRMDANSAPFAMITAPDLMGARIEFVDEVSRPAIEEWVQTGKYPGGVGG